MSQYLPTSTITKIEAFWVICDCCYMYVLSNQINCCIILYDMPEVKLILFNIGKGMRLSIGLV